MGVPRGGQLLFLPSVVEAAGVAAAVTTPVDRIESGGAHILFPWLRVCVVPRSVADRIVFRQARCSWQIFSSVLARHHLFASHQRCNCGGRHATIATCAEWVVQESGCRWLTATAAQDRNRNWNRKRDAYRVTGERNCGGGGCCRAVRFPFLDAQPTNPPRSAREHRHKPGLNSLDLQTSPGSCLGHPTPNNSPTNRAPTRGSPHNGDNEREQATEAVVSAVVPRHSARPKHRSRAPPGGRATVTAGVEQAGP